GPLLFRGPGQYRGGVGAGDQRRRTGIPPGSRAPRAARRTGRLGRRRGGMTRLARFRELIGAYGAEPGRWPAGERAEAEALLGRLEEARAVQREAAILDALLDQAPRPALPRLAPATLAARITARPQETARSPWRPRETVWLRAVGLAAAAIIGFVVGTTQLA